MNKFIATDANLKPVAKPSISSMKCNKFLSSSLAALGVVTGLSLLVGCGKSERDLTTAERLKSVATVQETQSDFFAPKSNARDYMKELKDIRDNPKSEPAAIAAANKAIETGKNDPSRLAAAAAAVVPATPPAAPPVLTTTPTLAPAVTVAPVVVPPVVAAAAAAAPAPTPAPVVAVARPAPTTETRAISREQPEFPREAAQRGIDAGTVRARATINAAGDVTGVTIVISNPARVFDRAVTSAFKNWKFNQGADNRSFEGEFDFKR